VELGEISSPNDCRGQDHFPNSQKDYDKAAAADRGLAGRLAASLRNRQIAKGRGAFTVKVAVLGTGGVGGVLGARWAKAGHDVAFGSRDPQAERVCQLVGRVGGSCRAVSPGDAIVDAEVITLAVPWPAAQQTAKSLGDLGGRVLIDCTNPLKPDLSGIELGHTTSAAEQIQGWCPTARVVKAFNTASTKVMNDPNFAGRPAAMFFCGDDAAAKATVSQLIADLGFSPVDAGPLTSARYLEPLAMLYIHLAFKQGWGSNCAFQILKR
jgi:predicted dinucleotide-binding enzyme